MTTQKQIEANRQNALRSTGPKTALGKTISSRNATRHGFYATTVLLPDEDQEEFRRLARRLVLAYAPCGVLEEEQVRTILESRWPLRRASLVDAELFQMYGFCEGEQRGVGTAFAQDATQGNAFTKLTRYQSFLLRRLQLAEKELRDLKATAASQTAITCQTITSDLRATPVDTSMTEPPTDDRATTPACA
jgi:hypothetical protein